MKIDFGLIIQMLHDENQRLEIKDHSLIMIFLFEILIFFLILDLKSTLEFYNRKLIKNLDEIYI